jgi:hypothetical protein
MGNNKYPLNYFVVIFVLTIGLFTSCCNKKGPLVIKTIEINSPNLSESKELYAITTHKKNLNNVIDTLLLTTLNESNNYSFLLEIKASTPSHIFYIEDTNHRDTISHIEVLKIDCRGSVEDFTYQLNGKTSTAPKISFE